MVQGAADIGKGEEVDVATGTHERTQAHTHTSTLAHGRTYTEYRGDSGEAGAKHPVLTTTVVVAPRRPRSSLNTHTHGAGRLEHAREKVPKLTREYHATELSVDRPGFLAK